jgi:hypothetical protein
MQLYIGRGLILKEVVNVPGILSMTQHMVIQVIRVIGPVAARQSIQSH